jgi:hypothetical protein
MATGDSLGDFLGLPGIPMYPRSLTPCDFGQKSPKILLQNCDGRFQIESADQACRERGRCPFAAVRQSRISAFVSEFAGSTMSDHRK